MEQSDSLRMSDLIHLRVNDGVTNIEDKPLQLEENEFFQYKRELKFLYNLRYFDRLIPNPEQFQDTALRVLARKMENASKAMDIYDGMLLELHREMQETELKDKKNETKAE